MDPLHYHLQVPPSSSGVGLTVDTQVSPSVCVSYVSGGVCAECGLYHHSLTVTDTVIVSMVTHVPIAVKRTAPFTVKFFLK